MGAEVGSKEQRPQLATCRLALPRPAPLQPALQAHPRPPPAPAARPRRQAGAAWRRAAAPRPRPARPRPPLPGSPAPPPRQQPAPGQPPAGRQASRGVLGGWRCWCAGSGTRLADARICGPLAGCIPPPPCSAAPPTSPPAPPACTRQIAPGARRPGPPAAPHSAAAAPPRPRRLQVWCSRGSGSRQGCCFTAAEPRESVTQAAEHSFCGAHPTRPAGRAPRRCLGSRAPACRACLQAGATWVDSLSGAAASPLKLWQPADAPLPARTHWRPSWCCRRPAATSRIRGSARCRARPPAAHRTPGCRC